MVRDKLVKLTDSYTYLNFILERGWHLTVIVRECICVDCGIGGNKIKF